MTDGCQGMQDCPFCNIGFAKILAQNDHAIATADGFPVSPGHALVVPRRHVGSLFDLDAADRAGTWLLIDTVRATLMAERSPDGFNVGVNDGRAAGQTVMHAHIHIIPRYDGDVSNPRGGIRWVIQSKTPYWKGGQ